MAFCPNCGTHNADDSAFCISCGQPLAGAGSPGGAIVTSGQRYGGFWRRLLAFVIDAVIIGIPIGIIARATHLYTTSHLSNGNRLTQLSGGGELLAVLVCWAYFTLQEISIHQATVGKRALGMRVTDNAGARLTFGRATGRYFASLISWVTVGLGFVLAAFTPRKRALHDMIASTLVCRT